MLDEDLSDLAHLDEKRMWVQIDKRRAAARKRLATIFGKYCEAGVKATRVNDVLHHGGGEPDYNPKKEKLVSLTQRGSTVVIETQMTHNFRFKLKYQLVRAKDGWLIRDNRKCMQDFQTKWSRWDL